MKFPVGYPSAFSSAIQIHCAITDAPPAPLLFRATATPKVTIDGTLQVTHALNGPELGKAPQAQRKRQPYRAVYASAGSRPAVSQPMPPMVEMAATCQPRALKWSALQPMRRQTM